MPALINNTNVAITANSVNVDLDIRDAHFASITVVGTFVATLSFFVSNDKTNWFPINLTPTNSATPALSATAAGGFYGAVQPWAYLRAGTTAFTSGSLSVGVFALPIAGV